MYLCFYSVSNLKYWSTRVAVINKTLHLLSDLSIGFSSVRKLLTLDIVKFTMEGHTVSLSHDSHMILWCSVHDD